MIPPRWTASDESGFNRQAARWIEAVESDETVQVDRDGLERTRQLVDGRQHESRHRGSDVV